MAKEKYLLQEFYCEACEKRGCVRFLKGAELWGVAVSIQDKHRLMSPRCVGGSCDIRIKAPSCTIEEWGRITAKKPQKLSIAAQLLRDKFIVAPPPAAASSDVNDAVEAARKSEKSLAREKGESQ